MWAITEHQWACNYQLEQTCKRTHANLKRSNKQEKRNKGEDPRYYRKREEERRKGVKGGTGHSTRILTAWENNGQKDERQEGGGRGDLGRKEYVNTE